MYTLDTNAIIYYMKGDTNAVNFLDGVFAQEGVFYVSAITELELFGFSGLTNTEADHIENMLETVTVIPVDSRIARLAGTIRSRFGTAVPDSTIVATALATGSTLITRNTKDFKNASGLTVVCL